MLLSLPVLANRKGQYRYPPSNKRFVSASTPTPKGPDEPEPASCPILKAAAPIDPSSEETIENLEAEIQTLRDQLMAEIAPAEMPLEVAREALQGARLVDYIEVGW